MSTEVKEETKEVKEEKQEDKFDPSEYSCEIILEKTTADKANDRKLPSDAFNVYYTVDGEDRLDVTRSGKKVNIFDMYYDRYGNVKKIDYGHGTVNPSQWGIKNPKRKRKENEFQ